MADDTDLNRFVRAQTGVFPTALEEVAAGDKQSHWMWFIFPQLRGLGHSSMAEFYGIAGLDEARRYLAHPVLGPRLRQITAAVLPYAGKKPAVRIFGTPDDMKLRSCMTLFREAALADGADGTDFQSVLDGFYDGQPDRETLRMLGLSG